MEIFGRVHESNLLGQVWPEPAFVNNTIVNNTAMDGSGFFIMDHTPFLLNNILWNEPQDTMEWGEIYLGDVPEWTQWHGPNTYGGIALHYSDVRGGWGDTLGNIDNDPLFLDSTYRLSDTSPCIGAGTDSLEALPPYDVQIAGAWHHAPAICYYGSPRPNPADSPPDIGACENHRARPLESVAEERAALPNWFHLGQNYPNPFNPSTTIEFSFQHAGYATLSVYNVLGEEVATLIAGDHSAGTFKTTWNTSEVPSGVYFYRPDCWHLCPDEEDDGDSLKCLCDQQSWNKPRGDAMRRPWYALFALRSLMVGTDRARLGEYAIVEERPHDGDASGS